MPAQTTEQPPKRREVMTFRTTTTERERLLSLAARQGLSLSGLIRQGLELQGFEPER